MKSAVEGKKVNQSAVIQALKLIIENIEAGVIEVVGMNIHREVREIAREGSELYKEFEAENGFHLRLDIQRVTHG